MFQLILCAQARSLATTSSYLFQLILWTINIYVSVKPVYSGAQPRNYFIVFVSVKLVYYKQ